MTPRVDADSRALSPDLSESSSSDEDEEAPGEPDAAAAVHAVAPASDAATAAAVASISVPASSDVLQLATADIFDNRSAPPHEMALQQNAAVDNSSAAASAASRVRHPVPASVASSSSATSETAPPPPPPSLPSTSRASTPLPSGMRAPLSGAVNVPSMPVVSGSSAVTSVGRGMATQVRTVQFFLPADDDPAVSAEAYTDSVVSCIGGRVAKHYGSLKRRLASQRELFDKASASHSKAMVRLEEDSRAEYVKLEAEFSRRRQAEQSRKRRMLAILSEIPESEDDDADVLTEVLPARSSSGSGGGSGSGSGSHGAITSSASISAQGASSSRSRRDASTTESAAAASADKRKEKDAWPRRVRLCMAPRVDGSQCLWVEKLSDTTGGNFSKHCSKYHKQVPYDRSWGNTTMMMASAADFNQRWEQFLVQRQAMRRADPDFGRKRRRE